MDFEIFNNDSLNAIANTLNEERFLDSHQFSRLFCSLQDDDKLKRAVLSIYSRPNTSEIEEKAWLTRILNTYFHFEPIWTLEGVQGFRVKERTKVVEDKIFALAREIRNSALERE